jgi:hypothetical protein
VKHTKDLGKEFIVELEEFFVNYHQLSGKEYRILDARVKHKSGSRMACGELKGREVDCLPQAVYGHNGLLRARQRRTEVSAHTAVAAKSTNGALCSCRNRQTMTPKKNNPMEPSAAP